MSAPIVRKKRNFKALQLDVSPPPPVEDAPVLVPNNPAPIIGGTSTIVAIATRPPPNVPTGGRRKPPAMDLSKSKVIPVSSANKSGSPTALTVNASHSAPTSATLASAQRSTYHHKLQEQLATLDIRNPEARLDLTLEDLKTIGELGQGNGGTVSKVEHTPTQTIMAKKVGHSIP